MDPTTRFKKLIEHYYNDCYLSGISITEKRIQVEGPLNTVMEFTVTGKDVHSSVMVLGQPARYLLPSVITGAILTCVLGGWLMRLGYEYTGAYVFTFGFLASFLFIRVGRNTLLLWESLRLNTPRLFDEAESLEASSEHQPAT